MRLLFCMAEATVDQPDGVIKEIVYPVVSQKMLKIWLGTSRVIYNPDSSGASLSVKNVQYYPIPVQGKVFAEDEKHPRFYIVIPPVSRLDAQ